MKPLLVAIIGLVLVGFCAISSGMSMVLDSSASTATDCLDFSERPSDRWVKLEGCVLDFDTALLSNGTGVFERLEDRKNGLWSKLPDGVVTWREVLVPVRTAENRARPARLVVALADADLLAWLNSLERASGDQHTQLLRRGGVLQRFANPGALVVHATHGDDADQIQTRLGRDVSAGVFVLRAGTPPLVQVPILALVCGLSGVACILWALAAFNRRGHKRDATPLEEAQLDVRGVKVELGELEALRDEERKRR